MLLRIWQGGLCKQNFTFPSEGSHNFDLSTYSVTFFNEPGIYYLWLESKNCFNDNLVVWPIVRQKTKDERRESIEGA